MTTSTRATPLKAKATPKTGSSALGEILPEQLTIAQLEKETGVTARNIRYYVSQKLLPAAHKRGTAATYDQSHLLRLRMIQRLQKDHFTIAQMREEMVDLSDRDILSRLNMDALPDDNRWRRVVLHPDLELHVREQTGKEIDTEFQRAVEGIIHFAEKFLPPSDKRR